MVIDPNFGEALKGKGITFNALGKYTQAIHYFNKALAVDPNDIDTLNENLTG